MYFVQETTSMQLRNGRKLKGSLLRKEKIIYFPYTKGISATKNFMRLMLRVRRNTNGGR